MEIANMGKSFFIWFIRLMYLKVEKASKPIEKIGKAPDFKSAGFRY
jgi:hypothetical protein